MTTPFSCSTNCNTIMPTPSLSTYNTNESINTGTDTQKYHLECITLMNINKGHYRLQGNDRQQPQGILLEQQPKDGIAEKHADVVASVERHSTQPGLQQHGQQAHRQQNPSNIHGHRATSMGRGNSTSNRRETRGVRTASTAAAR